MGRIDYPAAAGLYYAVPMLTSPAGTAVTNALAAGTEALGTTFGTRFAVDWSSMTVLPTATRVQAVMKSTATTTAATVVIRDITNSVNVCSVSMASLTVGQYAGAWTNFVSPGAQTVYAVYVLGNGTIDPTLYNVMWEWLA